MLVFYIQHITNSIRIDTIMQRVENRTRSALDTLHPELNTRTDPPVDFPDPSPDAASIMAPRSGYVQGYNIDTLLKRCLANNAAMVLVHPIGHHVVRGRPVAQTWALDGVAGASRQPARPEWSAAGIVIRSERMIERDVAFGIRQLVDIAIKAIGPSINDPYTATQAVQHLSVIIVELAKRSLHDEVSVDSSGVPRILLPTSGFDDYLDLVCSHVRQEAANRPRVMVALLRLLEDVATMTDDPARRLSIARQVQLVLTDAKREIAQEADLEELERVAAAALAATAMTA